MSVAIFRPDDERLAEAVELLEAVGVEPVADPMLEVDPTGALPRQNADVVVLTSRTGADILAAAEWTPGGQTSLSAIGATTAQALRGHGYTVDVVPAEFSSAGLVEALRGRVDGAVVDVARSDHGSPLLMEGLDAAGATVHETVLYQLDRPASAGRSVELAAAGTLDAALFTSSLTVEHFLGIAAERGIESDVRRGLATAIVGAIGPPTKTTAEEHGIAVDVVAPSADFETLARAVVDALDR